MSSSRPRPWRQGLDDYRAQLETEFERHMAAPREHAKQLQEVVFNLNDKMHALLEKEKQVSCC